MKIESYQGNFEELEADLLVLVLDQQETLFELPESDLAQRVAGLQSAFTGGKYTREFSFDPNGGGVKTVVAYSTELEKVFGLWENLKIFAARAVKLAADTGRTKVVFALNSAEGLNSVAKIVEGIVLGCYTFDKYKKAPKKPFESLEVILWTAEGSTDVANTAIERATTFAQAVNLARDLANEPGSVLTPAALVRQGQMLESDLGLKMTTWGPEKLAEERCVGLTAVGGGSEHPPYMFTLTYEPEEPSDIHLVLLGKGVTFDTGGISIKPAEKMELMRADMSGAAAVLGAISVIGKLKPKVKVTAMVVAAENSPDGKAFRPGDILVYRNGKSVHVENTDAEGRLILADGLLSCADLGATHIVDIATLTGAAARALGPSFTGLMGNNRTLVNAITRAGGNHGEAYWKLPLPAEYKEMLKCAFADLNNMGGPAGGAMTAGLFLQEFVPAGAAWAHLDIAPTFWREKPWKYFSEGPTGVGVRTLAELALNWTEHTAR
jgi:leucyl aminopeptidase